MPRNKRPLPPAARVLQTRHEPDSLRFMCDCTLGSIDSRPVAASAWPFVALEARRSEAVAASGAAQVAPAARLPRPPRRSLESLNVANPDARARRDGVSSFAHMSHPLRRLFEHARPYRREVAIASVFSVLNKIFDVLPEILIGMAVDVVVSKKAS